MKSQGITGNFTEANVQALAVAMFKDEKASGGALKDLDRITGGVLSATLRAGEFKGECGETALIRFVPSGKVKASRLLLVGVGSAEDYTLPKAADTAGTATRFLRKRALKASRCFPAVKVTPRRSPDRRRSALC